MSRNFQLQLIRKTLTDLGYDDVGEMLASKMVGQSNVKSDTDTDSFRTALFKLISAGDYEAALAMFSESHVAGEEVYSRRRGDGVFASTEEDEFHFRNNIPVLLYDLTPCQRSLAVYLVLRTAFLEKVLQSSFGAAPPDNERMAFDFLQTQVSEALDGLVRNGSELPLSVQLTKEHESRLLLPLALNPPSRDQINAQFTEVVLLKPWKQHFEDPEDDFLIISRLRNSLKSLLQHEVGLCKLDSRIASNLGCIDFPDGILADIIRKASYYNEHQGLYYLPARIQVSSHRVLDYTLHEKAQRDDLPIHLLHTLANHTDEVWFTRFSPSGRYLATGSLDGTCAVYDVTNNFCWIATLDPGMEEEENRFVPGSFVPPLDKRKGIIYLSWEPHERYIVTCCLDTVIRVWNVENIMPKRRKTRSQLGPERPAILQACFTLGERMRTWPCEFLKYDKSATPHFIVGSPDKVLKVYSIEGVEVMDFYSDADEWSSILGESQASAPVPAESQVDDAVRNTVNSTATNSAEETGTNGNQASQFNRINDFAITPNGKVLITANNDKQVLFYRIPNLFDPSTTTSRIASLKLNGRITSCNISADGKYMLLSISPEELQLWDISPLENFERPFLKQKFLGQSQAVYMVRSCFGYLKVPEMKEKVVLSGSDDGYIYLWKLETGQLLTRVKGHDGLCNSVDWNRFYSSKTGKDYGMCWCSVGDDQTVKIWGPKNTRS